MRKVVVLGPESTGKSTLTAELAMFFNTKYVAEFARDYLINLGKPYSEQDLLKIAKGQIKSEEQTEAYCIKDRSDILFYDTDLTVIKIWSEFKYGRCDPRILGQYKKREYDLYLVTYPDLDWEFDPLRENPEDRIEIFELYIQDLVNRDKRFTIIRGVGKVRTRVAIKAIQELPNH